MKVIEQLERMSEPRFLEIYESLARNGFGPLDGEVAKVMKFRPQAIRKLAMPVRAKRARALLVARRQAELCYELFGTYLLEHKKELVTGFLDATGVQHEDGMISDLDHNRPEPAKIAAAVQDLDARFDREDVTLYLALCAEQWPMVPELDALWRKR